MLLKAGAHWVYSRFYLSVAHDNQQSSPIVSFSIVSLRDGEKLDPSLFHFAYFRSVIFGKIKTSKWHLADRALKQWCYESVVLCRFSKTVIFHLGQKRDSVVRLTRVTRKIIPWTADPTLFFIEILTLKNFRFLLIPSS